MRAVIPPLPRHVFMTWCLDEHRDKFSPTIRAGKSTVGLLGAIILPGHGVRYKLAKPETL
jgi:hypothetical protein